MFQHVQRTSKRLVLAGYSLIEVSFVLMMVGVVVLPFLLDANEKNTSYENQVTPLENANLSSASLISLLNNYRAKRTELVGDITKQMAELASKGSKIVDKNMSAREELFSEPYLDNTATFFEDTDPSANVKYKYILPTAPGGTLSTSQKTFFLTTADGKYVPLFTYQWEFRDQSSNTDDDKQNTSTGTYLVRGELKVFEIATPTAQGNTATVSQTTPPTASLTAPFNVRNTPLVDDIKGNTPRVLLNFTFDMSRGACYSPATSQYSRRLTNDATTWTILDLISYDSGKGLLCAPYFQPSENNTDYSTDTPWADGEVRDASSVWRPDWYDIYYNSPSQLFWTNGLPSSKEVVDNSMPGTAMGFATSLEASGFKAAREGVYSSMPSSGDLFSSSAGTYTIRYPRLNNNSERNFPDGDFDAVALNYIRCKNHYVKGGQFATDSAGKAWASHFFGPNLGNTGNLYPQSNCAQFSGSWRTPANINASAPILYGQYTSSPPLLGSLKSWKWAFSRFWVRQDAGGFGADSGESSLGGQTFVTVEAARMAISSQLGSIGQEGYFKTSGLFAKPMKPVWSVEDNADEEQRWISGVEFQRSAALITLFQLLQHPTLSQTYDVSLLLNDPTEGTDEFNLTTYTPYPTTPVTLDPTQSNFKDVMKHLYGMNRLLGEVYPPYLFGPSFTNRGDEDYRHLANKRTFDVKQAIMDFRSMVTATGSRYDHFVNVIYFPSDMSGDATQVLYSGDKDNSTGMLNAAWTTTLGNDLELMIPDDIMSVVAPTNDPLKGKITYVLVVHMDTYDLFKDRVKWLKTEMEKKDVKVIYKEVKGIYDQPPARDDYETFVNDTLLKKLENIKATVTPGSLFNKMGKEQYSY
jgi:hypothetical protein